MLKNKSCDISKILAAVLLFGTTILGGCSSIMTRTELEEVGIVDDSSGTAQLASRNAGGASKGVVPQVWEEPMVDDVEVPPGLDPEGHYYIPAHRAIIEIRQGRWQYYNMTEEVRDR